MKTFFRIAAGLCGLLGVSSSCFRFADYTASSKAVLSLSYSDALLTRAGGPASDDILDYTLRICNSKGATVYCSLWGELYGGLELDAGDYTVSLLSDEGVAPAFDAPIFGDACSVSLAAGEVKSVELVLHQTNCGLRLLADDAFVALYRDNDIFLKSYEGTLAYPFSETRTAFFQPGTVSVVMSADGISSSIHVIRLNAGEMLTLRLVAKEKVPMAVRVTGLGLTASIDTSRIWMSEDFAYDGSGSGSGNGEDPSYPADAVSVAVARTMAGAKGQWVCGYVVGGDLSSSSCSFEGPFSSRTNLMLADSAGERERSRCMSVQLSQGDIRNALNLVDNPEVHGKKIYLKGNIVETYYKLPGLQGLTDYRK